MGKSYVLTGIDEKKWREFQACCKEQGRTAKKSLLAYIYFTADLYKDRTDPKGFGKELLFKGGKKK